MDILNGAEAKRVNKLKTEIGKACKQAENRDGRGDIEFADRPCRRAEGRGIF